MVRRPNIVLVLADNLGFGELGVYGGGQLRGAPTPRIDALASQGIRLTNMNMESQCTPSRSALMTGRFSMRSGTMKITQPSRAGGLVRWERTLAQQLSDAGYRTGHFGKWHLGNVEGRHPTDRGFDEWWGLTDTHATSLWCDSAEYRGTRIEPARLMEGVAGSPSRTLEVYDRGARARFDAEAFARATDFIRRCAVESEPFFAYLPIAFPHFPVIPNPDFQGRTGNGDFADGLVEMDSRVGALLDELERLNLVDDTIFIFTSDNGAEETLPSRGWAGPWAGSYFTAMEGCLRVPCIVRWPGRVPAGVVSNEIVHAVDLYPTLIRWAGGVVPDDRPIDGKDMGEFLCGSTPVSGRTGFPVYVGDQLHAVKWRNWKFHFVWQEYMYEPAQKLPIPRAFNLLDDPRERHDVFLPANSWIQFPVSTLLDDWHASLAAFPSVPVGAPDDWLPEAV